MSSTTDSNKPAANGLGVNDAQKGYAGTRPSTRPQGQREEPRVPAAIAQHAENYDDAPPGVPGPDHSARDTLRQQAKPVFNRGPSVLDFTAVTSAGPTPAGEPGPSASYFDGSRLRESHLPDQVELPGPGTAMRRQAGAETDSEPPRRVPAAEVRGGDAFAPRTSRRETEAGAQDETSGWTGANDTFGGHA
ncbi:hypothetical protein UCDDA912_g07181 [Diaporthe ampelina]|uniref:Uncharacterized protein n=1 Tax=Diaporthe ampelina TaxID=1214573 RepID=A0A0G2FFE2_9PEZI|nr:hypothetical protein UCDDA912_g07181 [Diaporthe ampelina]